jgi:zinc protease
MRKANMRHILILTALTLFCSIPAFSQQPAPLPDLTTKRLLNDLQITVAKTPYLGSNMAIGLVVRYGAYFDPAGKGGVANLLARMFLKAATDKTAKDIQDELAYLEANIEVRCDWDGFRFILKGQSAKVERSLLLLYQVIGEAQFNDADFAAVKQSVLAEMQKIPDPRQRIHAQFENVLFSGTSHARPLEGTANSVSTITAGDVRYFYRKFITPNQASLIIVGDVTEREVMQRATRIWGVWVRNSDVPFTFVQPHKPAGRQMFIEDDASSPAAQFIIGNLFPPRENPAYGSALLAAGIFQERLTKALPTSLLTVGSAGRRMASPFYVQGQAAAEQAVEQILRIESVAEEMTLAAVTNEELDAARSKMMEEFNRELVSTEGVCRIMLDAELYRLGSNYTSTYPEQLRRYDANAVKQAAKNFLFPDGIVLLVRGPAATLKPVLSPLGTLKTLTPEL